MKLELLPIATLRALSVEEQDALARQAAQVEKAAINATERHKSSFPATGKVVCVIEERLNELKSTVNPDGSAKKPQIAVNTSLATYWENLTKRKLNNHAYSCAVAFGTYVRTELVQESDYDKNPAHALELAASISTAVGGDVTRDEIIEAADLLKDRPKDLVAQLRKILASLKDPKELKPEKVREMLAAIFAAGHLNIVVAMTGAEVAHLDDTETGKTVYFGLTTAVAMFEQNVDADGNRRFPDEMIDGWLNAREKEIREQRERAEREATTGSPVQIVSGETDDGEIAEVEDAAVAA